MIPAGAAIVALSDVRTVLVITLPRTFVITTFFPAAPWISTAPLPAITLTPSAASAIDSLAVGSPVVIVKRIAFSLLRSKTTGR